MANPGEMANYLPVVMPDRTITLSVRPQEVMNESAGKNIVVHRSDSRQEKRVILSDETEFHVTLRWTRLSAADAKTLLDFWCDPAKANGLAFSFKWVHPSASLDPNTYVCRFDSDIQRTIRGGSVFGITEVRLKVLGVAAP